MTPLNDANVIEGTLDPAGSFVIRFRSGSRRGGPVAGRVEHVSTGRQSRFASLEELAGFMLDRLPVAEGNPTRDP